jgi:hypothetical protein
MKVSAVILAQRPIQTRPGKKKSNTKLLNGKNNGERRRVCSAARQDWLLAVLALRTA